MTILRPMDWIFPVAGGPFGAVSDEKFRSHWEVPTEVPAEFPAPAAVESAPNPVAVVPETVTPEEGVSDAPVADGAPDAA
jgi:hypothetical protein